MPKEPEEFKLSSLAYSRQRWNDTFRSRLSGLLREHTKSYLVSRLGIEDHWSDEVSVLARKAEEMLNPSITKKKGKWGIYSVAAESFLEAAGDQYRCKEAMKDFVYFGFYTKEEIDQVYHYYQVNLPDSEDILLDAMGKYFSRANFEGIIKEVQGVKASVEPLDRVVAFANVPQRVYRLPLATNIKFNILQPGDLRLSHAPRLKVFMKNPRTGPNFSISLTKDPTVVAGDSFLSAKDLKLVLEHVAKYHEAYLALWNDDGLDIDDLREKMDAIDKGGSAG